MIGGSSFDRALKLDLATRARQARLRDAQVKAGITPLEPSMKVMVVAGSQSDALDSPIIFIDGPFDTTWRPRRRNIPFVPPDAFDIPLMPEKPEKKADDGPNDDS